VPVTILYWEIVVLLVAAEPPDVEIVVADDHEPFEVSESAVAELLSKPPMPTTSCPLVRLAVVVVGVPPVLCVPAVDARNPVTPENSSSVTVRAVTEALIVAVTAVLVAHDVEVKMYAIAVRTPPPDVATVFAPCTRVHELDSPPGFESEESVGALALVLSHEIDATRRLPDATADVTIVAAIVVPADLLCPLVWARTNATATVPSPQREGTSRA
jgi:hypothetical protein